MEILYSMLCLVACYFTVRWTTNALLHSNDGSLSNMIHREMHSTHNVMQQDVTPFKWHPTFDRDTDRYPDENSIRYANFRARTHLPDMRATAKDITAQEYGDIMHQWVYLIATPTHDPFGNFTFIDGMIIPKNLFYAFTEQEQMEVLLRHKGIDYARSSI